MRLRERFGGWLHEPYTAAITAATSAVGLIDKISDQIERFITKRPEPSVPREHRQKIQQVGDAIVSSWGGQERQRITAQEIQKLPEQTLRHIRVLEQSMENHYQVWSAVYPQLSLAIDPVAKARTEFQLRGVVAGMKGDLEGILRFLEESGVQLDDHYQHVRSVVAYVP
jgi:hypothetical protein